MAIKNIKLEYFNLGTGICLFIAAAFYLFQQDITTALNWGIFGAMYLVMDEYKCCDPSEKTLMHRIREAFGVVGFVLSIVLLLYIFLS